MFEIVVQESRRCVVSVTTEAQFISSSSSSSSSSSDSAVSSCGSKSHPWRLEAAAGQLINISLLDFTAAMSMSAAEKRPRDRVTCRQYGYVLEKWNKRNVSVCGAELRQSHVYISHSNNVQIFHPYLNNMQVKFLLKLTGTVLILQTLLYWFVFIFVSFYVQSYTHAKFCVPHLSSDNSVSQYVPTHSYTDLISYLYYQMCSLSTKFRALVT